MEVALSGSLLRTFFKSAACLAKIGAEVLIEAAAGQGLTLKAMNSARSAFCSVTFKQASFDLFTVREGTLQTAVLAKHLAAALRTQRLERIVLSQAANDRSKLSVQLECGRVGLTKTYGLHCVTDAEHLKATIDPTQMPVKLVTRARELGRLLSHFQSGQNDITVSCMPEEDGADAFRDHRAGSAMAPPPARNLRLSSFADPNAPPGQALQTSISLDTAEDAILRYEHDGANKVDVTVNLKDLRAMVAFCESVDVDVAMFCETAGAPMLVRPTAKYRGSHRAQGADAHREQHRGPYFDAAAVDFDAELVLASMLPQGAEEPTETLGGTARPERRGGESVAGPTMQGDPRDSAAASGRSELTERAAKLGHGHVRGPGVARSAATSAVPDSEDGSPGGAVRGGGGVGGDGGQSVGNAPLAWAPGAPADDAGDDREWEFGGDEFVEATPPEKRRRY